MINVLVKGPLTTQSGYGQHSRQVVRWAFEQLEDTNKAKVYTKLLPWGITPWYTDTNAEDGLIGRIYQSNMEPPTEGFDASFQIQLPNEWDPNAAKFNIGITAAVETSICNPEWIDCCNRMDLVVVPSNFTKDVLANTCRTFNKELTVDVLVIPESFPDVFLKEDTVDSPRMKIDHYLDNVVKTNFNFLIFGQITGGSPEDDRKNIPYTIKWICETFANNEDVGIIIKTNKGRHSRQDRDHVTALLESMVSQIKSINPNIKKGPKIYLLHGHLTDKEINKIYTHPKVKAIVSPTRGEGFGIPLLEAAASGLPVIATNWSGHKDFLQRDKFVKLDYRLTPIPPRKVDNKIFVNGAQWAEVNEQDFKRRLKKFHETSSIPKQWALELQKDIVKNYCFDTISKKFYNDMFHTYLTSHD